MPNPTQTASRRVRKLCHGSLASHASSLKAARLAREPWHICGAGVCFVALLLAGRAPAQDRVDPPPKYAAAVKALEAFVAAEVRDKQLPALSIALVDDQQTVWAAGFGV